MAIDTTPHYPTTVARRADLAVHVVGLLLAVVGAAVALGLTITHVGSNGMMAAIAIYAMGLIAMFVFSTAYNFAPAKHQSFLRRLDHAGVFLMIASSYTPFTTQVLTGNWSLGMSAAVWILAGLGMLGKLLLPDLGKIYWVGFYLILGWLVVLAFEPLYQALPLGALILLVCGGLAYSIGTIFYANKRLIFRRAIWHAHVLVGAGLHYFAIVFGVILKGING